MVGVEGETGRETRHSVEIAASLAIAIRENPMMMMNENKPLDLSR